MTVEPVFAQWLQSEGLWQVQQDAPGALLWGERGIATKRMTCLAHKADAAAEAQRQLAFLRGPLALDVHLLKGEWRVFRGRVIRLFSDKLGYEAGADVFVIGVEDDRSTGLSSVSVLRRLGA